MLQEDSNGETTFEIIDKKVEDMSLTAERAESISSMSSAASLLPSPSVSIASVPSVALGNAPNVTGNLLSNVPPPSALPSFIPTTVLPPPHFTPTLSRPQSVPSSIASMPNSGPQMQPFFVPPPVGTVETQPTAEPYYPTQFSAAIPPSKGVQHGTIPARPSPPGEDSGGFLGWMKGAVSSGGILSKVAEKAKNSVDSMITTLDPQMKEYIYSGGDVDILVASAQEVKISSVREAFQSVFGKATVEGYLAQATNIAKQPVGFAAGVKAAEERIQVVFKDPKIHPLPVVSIENFLLEVGEDKWYDLGVLILNDPVRQITLQTFTQMTPVPTALVTLAQEDTAADYPLRWSGFSVTIGSLMAKNLGVPHDEWHEALTGVSRRDITLLAAKALAYLYKSSIKQGQ